MMKKTITSAIILLCLFCACKKSSNNSPATSIVGTWYETKVVLHQTTDGANPSGDTTLITNKSVYVTFNSNGTGTSVAPGSSNNFTYSLSGSALIISPNSDNGTYTVQSLTSNSFILHEVFSYTQGSDTIAGTIDTYLNK